MRKGIEKTRQDDKIESRSRRYCCVNQRCSKARKEYMEEEWKEEEVEIADR